MNKVTFGLSNVYIAFLGVAQVESIAVTAACSLDGEITVTVTGTPLTGGSEAVKVALATESHASVSQVASVICDALNNNADVSAHYIATHIDGVIYLAAKVVAANDATLDIAVTAGSTGITVGSSTAVAAGTTGWGDPIAIPGAVNFTPDPASEDTVYYADDEIYYFYSQNNGYKAKLGMTLVPDAILATMLGWEVDSNGMLVEVADGTPTHFALMGQVLGDVKNRRFVYYDCVASRPSKEHKTREGKVEPSPDNLDVTIFPIEVNSKNIVKGVMELSSTNTTAYNAFFNAVTTPAA